VWFTEESGCKDHESECLKNSREKRQHKEAGKKLFLLIWLLLRSDSIRVIASLDFEFSSEDFVCHSSLTSILIERDTRQILKRVNHKLFQSIRHTHTLIRVEERIVCVLRHDIKLPKSCERECIIWKWREELFTRLLDYVPSSNEIELEEFGKTTHSGKREWKKWGRTRVADQRQRHSYTLKFKQESKKQVGSIRVTVFLVNNRESTAPSILLLQSLIRLDCCDE
jgi:hypothetical protein